MLNEIDTPIVTNTKVQIFVGCVAAGFVFFSLHKRQTKGKNERNHHYKCLHLKNAVKTHKTKQRVNNQSQYINVEQIIEDNKDRSPKHNFEKENTRSEFLFSGEKSIQIQNHLFLSCVFPYINESYFKPLDVQKPYTEFRSTGQDEKLLNFKEQVETTFSKFPDLMLQADSKNLKGLGLISDKRLDLLNNCRRSPTPVLFDCSKSCSSDTSETSVNINDFGTSKLTDIDLSPPSSPIPRSKSENSFTSSYVSWDVVSEKNDNISELSEGLQSNNSRNNQKFFPND